MRVVLEVQSETNFGRKVWLGRDQFVSVGRTEQAGFALPLDPAMSRIHFSLECDRASCRARDMGSTGGTWLNGNRISESMLHNGDELRAGHTRFKVLIEGAEEREAAPVTENTDDEPVASEVLHSAGPWDVRVIPDQWEPVLRGIRRSPDEEISLGDLVLAEKNALTGVALKDHLKNLGDILKESVPGTETEAPEEIELFSSQRAWQLIVRFPENGGVALVQRMIMVNTESRLGTATFTTTAADEQNVTEEMNRITRGLEFREEPVRDVPADT